MRVAVSGPPALSFSSEVGSMTKIIRFLRALARHPKTSALGLAGLAGFGISSYQNPQQLAEPGTWVAVLTAIGLVLAADSSDDDDKTPPPPVDSSSGRNAVVDIEKHFSGGAGNLCA